ncbi:MAG: putative rane protein [Labilithrix sp.]|nr:putative rane protein [Labilithrix sp.]
MTRERTSARFAAAAALVAGLAWATRAQAHAIGLSTGEYVASGDSVTMKAVFARGEIGAMAPALDEDGDGHITALEIEQGRKILEAQVLARIHVRSGGASCPALLLSASMTEQDGLAISGRFDCPEAGPTFEVEVALLDELAPAHRHVARGVSGATTHDEVLSRGHASFTIVAGPRAVVAAPAPVEAHGDGHPAARWRLRVGGVVAAAALVWLAARVRRRR